MAYYKPEELENIRKGLEWAKKNPAEPKSIEIQNRLKSGQLNFELKALGLKEVPVQVPKIVMPKMSEAGQMSTQKPTIAETAKEMGGDVMDTAKNIGTTISEGAQNIQDIIGNKEFDPAQKTMGVLGSLLGTGAKTIGNVTTGVGKVALSQDAENQLKSFVQEKAQGIAENETVKKVADWYGNLSPDNKLIVDSAGGFASLVSEILAGGTASAVSRPIKEGVETAVETGIDLTKAGLKKADEFSMVNNANRVAKQEAKVDEAVARIIQGTPEDITKAKKALFELTPEQRSSTIDYKELREAADSNIAALSKKQDAELAQYTEKYTNDTLGKYTKVGNKTVVENPVKDALDGLENAYKMSGEAVNAERIAQLQNKLDTEGLTVQEINRIAKEYGTEYKSRSFDKAGNPKQGFNAESFENVRKGVKDVLRERLPGDVSKTLDESISAQYALKELAGTMEERAFKAYSKLRQKTLKEKVGEIGGVAFEAIDLLSLGTFRGFLSKMNLKVGKKFNDVIELEKELSKNLAQIDKLLAIKDEKKFTEAMAKYLEEVQPGLSTRVTSGLTNSEKDALLGKLNNIKSTDVTSDVPSGAASGGYKPELDLELSGRLDELKAKSEKAGGLSEREYAELKVLMDEVELNTNQSIVPVD